MTSDSTDAPSAVPGQEEANLRAQLALVNRLHIALRASLDPDDLVSIILAVLVAEVGLKFDHACFFEYDSAQMAFRGARAFGALTAERHEAIRREIREEQRWLLDRLEQRTPTATPDPDAATLSLELRGLHSNAFWLEAIQKYAEERALEEAIQEISIPCDHPGACRPLYRLAHGIATEPVALGLEDLTPKLATVLPQGAVAAPLRTRWGLYGVVLADLSFQGDSAIGPGQLTLFEWFVLQGSSALEHALLYGQKRNTIEQLREMETIKSSFLSTISHELRTPLTAVSGFTQILLTHKAGPINDQQREFLQRVQRHTTHLSDMVDDLLELAEEDAAAYEEEDLKPVDPLAALMKVIPRLEHRRKSKRVIIEPRISNKIPEILATEKIAERVLFHLLDNAVKFSPVSGRVFVRFQPSADRLTIEIEDHGIGIAPEDLKKIFQGFFQVDNRLSRSYEGLGIGLTLTKKLLMAIKGTIDVRSRLGEGTTVVVEFRVPTSGDSADAG